MKLIAFFISLLLLASCGPSEKEKIALLQAQKAKDDSAHTAEMQRFKDAEVFRSTLCDSLAAYSALLTRQQSTLTQLRTAIYTANDELTEIKTSHAGQPSHDQEKQELKIQSLIVQQITLQSEMQHNQAEISQIKSQLATAKR
ncbi:hypothetical protein ACQ86N_01265 [Puia sp. P3]|uniref:hypothetical protein n=1 Tax=Puia sp. P3 TaxID=3423952 RepID=UPI003D66BA76